MADNTKSLRVMSIVQTVFGSLWTVLVIVGIILNLSQLIYFIDIILAVTIILAGGLGIGATSPSRLNGPGRGLATGCMVLSIIAASLCLLGFILAFVALFFIPYAALFAIVVVALLFLAAELVVSIWSAVCCARMGVCGCCPQAQNQMPGQVVYVANQPGAVPIQGGIVVHQGAPAGTVDTTTSQAYPTTTAGMATHPMQMQAQGGIYPPPYPGEETKATETKVPL